MSQSQIAKSNSGTKERKRKEKRDKKCRELLLVLAEPRRKERVFKRDNSLTRQPPQFYQITISSMAFVNTLGARNCSSTAVLNLPNAMTL